jgi:hypothetical protein
VFTTRGVHWVEPACSVTPRASLALRSGGCLVAWGRPALLFALFTAMGGTGRLALAEPNLPSARLVYVREAETDDCPDEQEMKGAVASRLGYDPFQATSASNIEVHVARSDGHLVGRISLSDAAGKRVGERNLTSPNNCRELADAMALAISIAIDPLSMMRPQRAPVVSSPPSAERSVPSPPPIPLQIDLAAGAVGSVGVAPNLAWGGIFYVAVRRDEVSVGIEGRADVTQVSTVPGGTISTSLYDGSLVPCFHYRALAGCGVASFGALRSAGVDVVAPTHAFTPYVALGARAEAEVPVASVLYLRPRVDLVVPVTTTTLVVGGSAVWTTWRAAVNFGLVAGARLP